MNSVSVDQLMREPAGDRCESSQRRAHALIGNSDAALTPCNSLAENSTLCRPHSFRSSPRTPHKPQQEQSRVRQSASRPLAKPRSTKNSPKTRDRSSQILESCDAACPFSRQSTVLSRTTRAVLRASRLNFARRILAGNAPTLPTHGRRPAQTRALNKKDPGDATGNATPSNTTCKKTRRA